MNLTELFLEHVAASLDKQFYLMDLLGKHRWVFDMDEGKIIFNDSLSFSAQILGTESEVSNTWLWGWANEASGIPQELLEAVLEVKELGNREQIPEFTAAQLPLNEEINGHNLAIITSGIYQANAYYRGPYEGGAVFLLIKDVDFPTREVEEPTIRVAFGFPETIAAVSIANQRQAFIHYLKFYNLNILTDEYMVIGISENGKRVTAEFDSLNRMTKIFHHPSF